MPFILICILFVICNIKITYQCKLLIVPEEGWLGLPKYSTPTKNFFYVVSTSASIFFILFVAAYRVRERFFFLLSLVICVE